MPPGKPEMYKRHGDPTSGLKKAAAKANPRAAKGMAKAMGKVPTFGKDRAVTMGKGKKTGLKR